MIPYTVAFIEKVVIDLRIKFHAHADELIASYIAIVVGVTLGKLGVIYRHRASTAFLHEGIFLLIIID